MNLKFLRRLAQQKTFIGRATSSVSYFAEGFVQTNAVVVTEVVSTNSYAAESSARHDWLSNITKTRCSVGMGQVLHGFLLKFTGHVCALLLAASALYTPSASSTEIAPPLSGRIVGIIAAVEPRSTQNWDVSAYELAEQAREILIELLAADPSGLERPRFDIEVRTLSEGDVAPSRFGEGYPKDTIIVMLSFTVEETKSIDDDASVSVVSASETIGNISVANGMVHGYLLGSPPPSSFFPSPNREDLETQLNSALRERLRTLARNLRTGLISPQEK